MDRYTVRDILTELMFEGTVSSPRGLPVRELEYFQGEIMSPWSMYPHRKYDIDYFKREMQWYLGADPFDTSICKHASMWNKLIQKDGSILSNYGYYWFGPQGGYNWVVDTLTEDPDSRQAYIAMNNYQHAFRGNKDFVCTKGIQFRISDGLLNMHVAMRSSDAIYGLGTDLPCFYTLWLMVSAELDVPRGAFIFSADSVHLYKKHFEMAGDIVSKDGPYYKNSLDIPSIDDPDDLIQLRFQSPFGKWLTEVEL